MDKHQTLTENRNPAAIDHPATNRPSASDSICQEPPAPAAAAAAGRVPGPADSLRILVIEDNADLAETLCSLLELLGNECISANDGNTGIERFRASRPQVVFCDIGLPGRNGYKVAEALRCDPHGGQVYMIALSGYAQTDDIDRALAAGFNRHLSKPISIDMLREALSGIGSAAD